MCTSPHHPLLLPQSFCCSPLDDLSGLGRYLSLQPQSCSLWSEPLCASYSSFQIKPSTLRASSLINLSTPSLLTIHSLIPTSVKGNSAPVAAPKHLCRPTAKPLVAPTPCFTTPMVSIPETQWPSLHSLFGLNKDSIILVLRQEFFDFVPGCLDGLDNPQWGEVFLGCHENGITRFSLLVEVTQI